MHWKAVVVALALLPLAACSTREGRTAEIPGGGPAESSPPDARPPGFLARMFGNDDRPNAGPCPLMGVLYETSRIVEFASAEQRYSNIRFTGEMQGVRGLCRYVDDDPIEMNLEIDMAFGRGQAAAGERSRVFRYWVAVARRGRAPIEKQFFDVEVRFDDDEQVVTGTEEIRRIIIPRANTEVSGENFEVLVGFELTPEQLQFNREGRRFRMDAAAPANPS